MDSDMSTQPKPTGEWTGLILSRLIKEKGYKGAADAHNAALAAARGTCDQCSRKLEDGQLFNDHQPEPTCTCNKENRGASQHSSHCLAANRPHQPKPTGEHKKLEEQLAAELEISSQLRELMDSELKRMERAIADERERAYNKGRADSNTMYELAMRDNRKLDKEIQQLRSQLEEERVNRESIESINKSLARAIERLREQLAAEREKAILATQMVQIESKRANEAEQKEGK